MHCLQTRLFFATLADKWRVSVYPGALLCETGALNGCMLRLSHSTGRARVILRGWFTFGVALGCVGFVASATMLCWNLYRIVTTHYQTSMDQAPPLITPLMPGVTVPAWSFLYIWSAVFVSVVTNWDTQWRPESIVYGLSAWASSSVQYRVPMSESNKIFLTSDHYSSYKSCLVVLCILASGALRGMPWFLFPFYFSNGGAVVTDLPVHSVLQKHLSAGDIITAIDDSIVTDTFSLQLAIQSSSRDLDFTTQGPGTKGYCLSTQEIAATAQETHSRCCLSNALDSKGLCFTNSYSTIASGSSALQLNTTNRGQQWCLSARQVVTVSAGRKACDAVHRCNGSSTQPPAEEWQCLRPLLTTPDRLVRIVLADDSFVLFLGNPSAIGSSFFVSDYQTRGWVQMGLLPKSCQVYLLRMPQVVQRFLHFIWHVSASQALLNAAPVYMLDGQYACNQIIQLLHPCEPKKYACWSKAMLCTGTLLLFMNIAGGFLIWSSGNLAKLS